MSWTNKDWQVVYRNELFLLQECTISGVYRGGFKINLKEFKEWCNTTPSAYNILDENDTALFPRCLDEVKEYYLTHLESDFQETMSDLEKTPILKEYQGEHKGVYGYHLYANIVGNYIINNLCKHLNITHDEFAKTYGELLFEDTSSIDDLLGELLTTSHLVGEKRGHKIEVEV